MRGCGLWTAVVIVCWTFTAFAGRCQELSIPLVLDPLQAADRDFETALSIWGDGKSADAEALLKHALVLRTEALGPDHPSVADVLERLGAIDYNRRHFAFAEAKFRQALTIFVRSVGERNMQTLRTMGDLGAALREEGRYDEARPIVERSVALRREILASNDPAIAGGLNNLGRIYFAERRYTDAQKALEESLRIYQAGGPEFTEVSRGDEALLQRIKEAEGGVRRMLLMALAAGAATIIFGGMIIGCALLAERAYAGNPPVPPPLYTSFLMAIARVGFLIAIVLLGIGAAGAAFAYLGDNSNSLRAVLGGGAFAAIALFPPLLELSTNLARRMAGLPQVPITIFGRRIGAASLSEQDPESSAPWFPAMEYYAFAANRTFKVFVTPQMLCGARIGGLMASPLTTSSQMLEAAYWTQSPLARAYDRLGPESDAFRGMDQANFQIAWNEISSFEYKPGKKWGMGNVPNSGRLVVHLRSGASRELVLLGSRNGAVLTDELDRLRVQQADGGVDAGSRAVQAVSSGEA